MLVAVGPVDGSLRSGVSLGDISEMHLRFVPAAAPAPLGAAAGQTEAPRWKVESVEIQARLPDSYSDSALRAGLRLTPRHRGAQEVKQDAAAPGGRQGSALGMSIGRRAGEQPQGKRVALFECNECLGGGRYGEASGWYAERRAPLGAPPRRPPRALRRGCEPRRLPPSAAACARSWWCAPG